MLQTTGFTYQMGGVKTVVGDTVEFDYKGKTRCGRVHMMRWDTQRRAILITIFDNSKVGEIPYKNFCSSEMKNFRNVTLDKSVLAC